MSHRLWLVLQDIGSPMFLLISQLKEPLHILSVVALPVGGEEVSKQALHKRPDRAHVTVLGIWKDASIFDHLHCY